MRIPLIVLIVVVFISISYDSFAGQDNNLPIDDSVVEILATIVGPEMIQEKAMSKSYPSQNFGSFKTQSVLMVRKDDELVTTTRLTCIIDTKGVVSHVIYVKSFGVNSAYYDFDITRSTVIAVNSDKDGTSQKKVRYTDLIKPRMVVLVSTAEAWTKEP